MVNMCTRHSPTDFYFLLSHNYKNSKKKLGLVAHILLYAQAAVRLFKSDGNQI